MGYQSRRKYLAVLRAAIEKYVENIDQSIPIASKDCEEEGEDDIEVTVEDLAEFDSDGYDSEEEYYQ
jgi:hypothetical protein